MHVTETTLQQLIGGPKRFRVPLFQRTYTGASRLSGVDTLGVSGTTVALGRCLARPRPACGRSNDESRR